MTIRDVVEVLDKAIAEAIADSTALTCEPYNTMANGMEYAVSLLHPLAEAEFSHQTQIATLLESLAMACEEPCGDCAGCHQAQEYWERGRG